MQAEVFDIWHNLDRWTTDKQNIAFFFILFKYFWENFFSLTLYLAIIVVVDIMQ